MSDSSAQKLRTFLYELAGWVYPDDFTSRLVVVRDFLYKAVSEDGAHLERVFPGSSSLPFYENEFELKGVRSWNLWKPPQVNYGHEGRNCGHRFTNKDIIYRCADCGFDETCVLCANCFNKDDHVGHNVSKSVARSSNNGICDCGDEEAWTKELRCACQKPAGSEEDAKIFNKEYEDRLTVIFDVCFEFIIEVFSQQNQTLLSVQKRIQHERETAIQEDVLFTRSVMDKVHKPSQDVRDYYLVFWNDEVHNYSEAENAISICGKTPDPHLCNALAQRINDYGRTIITESHVIEWVLKQYRTAAMLPFPATVTDNQQFGREDVAFSVLKVLLGLLNNPNYNFQTISRSAMARSLLATYHLPSELAPFWQSDNIQEPYKGLLEGSLLPRDFVTSNTEVLIEPSKYESTRLKFLLFLEPRLWKLFRSKLKELLTAVLLSTTEFKLTAGVQVVDIYGLLLKNTLLFDREPLLTFLQEFLVQFLTCPITSGHIVEQSCNRLLALLYDVLSHMQWEDRPGVIRITGPLADRRLQRTVTYNTIFQTLKHLVEKTKSIKSFFHPTAFYYFCKIIEYHDDSYLITRKTGEHVELENLEYQVYEVAVEELNLIILSLTDEWRLDDLGSLELSHCTSKLMFDLASKLTKQKPRKVSKISSSKIGFYYPTLLLLSRLLKVVYRDSKTVSTIAQQVPFADIARVSLKRLVLYAQINARLWVRNGTSVLSMAAFYSEREFGDSDLAVDIYFLQLYGMIDPEGLIKDLISYFELQPFFSHAGSNVDAELSVYGNKAPNIMEQVLGFLYAMISKRSDFMLFDSKPEQEVHAFIEILRYMLFSGPLTFTQIEDDLDQQVITHELFEQTLHQLTDFTPPKGLQDEGMYSLKKEEFKHVDPLAFLAQKRDVITNVAVISKAIADGDDTLILIPQLDKLKSFSKQIGHFTRTTTFASIAHRFFEIALNGESETMLVYILHFFHAILMDSEMCGEKEHLLKIWMSSEIYQLLYQVVASGKYSRQITSKANLLFEWFLLQCGDEVKESIVKKHGAGAIDKYKQGISGLVESKNDVAQRKKIAKSRQARLLKKMKKKQAAFILKNETVNQEADVDTAGCRQCVMCQGFESTERLMLMPITLVDTDTIKRLPTSDDPYIKRAFMDWGDDTLEPDDEFVGKTTCQSAAYSRPSIISRVAVSCNHGFHFECLQDYLRRENWKKSSSVSCPLCKVKNDVYVPVLPNMVNDRSWLEKDYDMRLWRKIMTEGVVDILYDVQDRIMKLMETGDLALGFSPFEGAESVHIWSIFSLTISQAEIATRVNGNSAYTRFLDQIPEQTFVLLKSLFEYAVCLHGFSYPRDKKGKSHILDNISRTTSMITVFCILLFGTQIPFKEVVTGLVKIFIGKYGKNLHLDKVLYPRCKPFMNIDDRTVKVFGDFFPDQKIWFTDYAEEDIASRIGCIERLIIVDLRNIAIFMKVYDPTFVFSESAESFSVDSLLHSLGLPNLVDILSTGPKTEFPHYPLHESMVPPLGGLRYPGVVKLLDLPKSLNSLIEANILQNGSVFTRDDTASRSTNGTSSICLMCGKEIIGIHTAQQYVSHIINNCLCQSNAMFLLPATDEIKLFSLRGQYFYSKTINAPYLNSHGQSGRSAISNGRVATLSIERLKHLEEIWLSAGIYPYLTRTERGHRIGGSSFDQYEEFMNNLLEEEVAGLPGDTGMLLNVLREGPEGFFGSDTVDHDVAHTDDKYGLYGLGSAEQDDLNYNPTDDPDYDDFDGGSITEYFDIFDPIENSDEDYSDDDDDDDVVMDTDANTSDSDDNHDDSSDDDGDDYYYSVTGNNPLEYDFDYDYHDDDDYYDDHDSYDDFEDDVYDGDHDANSFLGSAAFRSFMDEVLDNVMATMPKSLQQRFQSSVDETVSSSPRSTGSILPVSAESVSSVTPNAQPTSRSPLGTRPSSVGIGQPSNNSPFSVIGAAMGTPNRGLGSFGNRTTLPEGTRTDSTRPTTGSFSMSTNSTVNSGAMHVITSECTADSSNPRKMILVHLLLLKKREKNRWRRIVYYLPVA
ncbi:UBR1 [Cyberlindnera jadinii]|uniref:E3 ubiquitin-protein ligase n=1 Tax=Cyberlindnera jadinii (strain ATCC 18201 / CBS 1600 / BCRC 20928 / JCM 3617 / NBRC 0987 / NRRL Y-1542) TaxID=983966 RepID=A0A0H5CDR8_CYBJN|nr:UBR1 [Cyberlindnera jadinii]